MDMDTVIMPAIAGHLLVRVDDYLTVAQARHMARQIMAVADDVEAAQIQETAAGLGEQLIGPGWAW